jgi:hypothetical protein
LLGAIGGIAVFVLKHQTIDANHQNKEDQLSSLWSGLAEASMR